MKMHKFIFNPFPKMATLYTLAMAMATTGLTSLAMSYEQQPGKVIFLQEIQDQLVHASGMKNRPVTVYVTGDKKRITALTPSSISLSHGFLKQMKDINQIVATLAHMTAHISLDLVLPLPEDMPAGRKKPLVADYLKSAIRPEYPDENNIPQATGAFHRKGAEILERPGYQNRNYDYSVNKTDIIRAEHELDVDRVTDKLLRRAGYCPADYSRLLHYFYEKPHLISGNRHFALDAAAWQRLDAVTRRADPAARCTEAQIALTRKHAGDFDRLQIAIMPGLRN